MQCPPPPAPKKAQAWPRSPVIAPVAARRRLPLASAPLSSNGRYSARLQVRQVREENALRLQLAWRLCRKRRRAMVIVFDLLTDKMDRLYDDEGRRRKGEVVSPTHEALWARCATAIVDMADAACFDMVGAPVVMERACRRMGIKPGEVRRLLGAEVEVLEHTRLGAAWLGRRPCLTGRVIVESYFLQKAPEVWLSDDERGVPREEAVALQRVGHLLADCVERRLLGMLRAGNAPPLEWCLDVLMVLRLFVARLIHHHELRLDAVEAQQKRQRKANGNVAVAVRR